jgi:enamine deaminase RidA (YjgF/YER057c/UK114 family)
MDISRKNQNGSSEVLCSSDQAHARFVTVRRETADDLAIFDHAANGQDTIVAQLVFGGCNFEPAARARMQAAAWPLLWVQGDGCQGDHLSGTQTFVLKGRAVERIVLDGNVVGSRWSDDHADYCLLAGIVPTDLAQSRGEQTTACLRRIALALEQAGMDFSHVARTWFYLDHLLDWYDEFNAARTAFFEQKGVMNGLIPASTGIGGGNPQGAALAAAALAIRSRDGQPRILSVPSPLQCQATEYRSSFSRAIEVAWPDRRFLTISGTASIAPGGASLFADDVKKQIHLTLDVVEAILQSRGMNWENTVRAVGYFRNIEDLPVFDACCKERGIAPLPLTPAHAVVCRDDLLFEMELDALSTAQL